MTSTDKAKRPRRMAREPKAEAAPQTDSGRTNAPAPDCASTVTSPKTPSKSELVLDLLRRKEGATLDELIASTGWLPHSARAALTGLRKKGHAIEHSRIDRVTHYCATTGQS